MERKNECLGFLGILYVGHKALIGDEALRSIDKASLAIMAKDSSSGESEKLKKKIKSRHIPMIELFTGEELGRALGKEKVSCIILVDKKAAVSFMKKMGL